MTAADVNREEQNPLLPVLYTVCAKRRETADTVTLEVAPRQGSAGSGCKPGQFYMLYIFGCGEVPISASRADAGGRLEFTVKSVGAVTRKLAQLKRGEALGLRGPFGSSWPVSELSGRDLLVIGGGVGLAPLRPVLDREFSAKSPLRSFALLYGTRTPGDVLYRRDLKRYSSRFRVRVTVDVATPAWNGPVGVVTTLLRKFEFEPGATSAFVCGPEIMLRVCIRELGFRGLRDDQIYLSLERNMKCATTFCGRCQFGPSYVCREGPVFRYDRIAPFFNTKEI